MHVPRSNELSVVHFYASWAEQCSQVNDVLEEMGKLEEYQSAKFAKIEAENLSVVSRKSEITIIPTILLLRNSNVVDRVDGINASKLTERIKWHLSNKNSVIPKEFLEARLKELIKEAPCMLFMKGNPAIPRCGFSKTIVSILNDHKADYKSFDILQDNDVREGLKKFSNWPTYPQLYVNGELIGGVDIVKQMSESGELNDVLPKKKMGELDALSRKEISELDEVEMLSEKESEMQSEKDSEMQSEKDKAQ